MFWKTDKSLTPAGIRTRYRPAPTTLKLAYASTSTRYCVIYTGTQNKPGSERSLLLYEIVCEICGSQGGEHVQTVTVSDATEETELFHLLTLLTAKIIQRR